MSNQRHITSGHDLPPNRSSSRSLKFLSAPAPSTISFPVRRVLLAFPSTPTASMVSSALYCVPLAFCSLSLSSCVPPSVTTTMTSMASSWWCAHRHRNGGDQDVVSDYASSFLLFSPPALWRDRRHWRFTFGPLWTESTTNFQVLGTDPSLAPSPSWEARHRLATNI